MVYGAVIGAGAAAFKLLAPWSVPHTPAVIVEEFVGGLPAFALLCGPLRHCATSSRAGWSGLELSSRQ